jgi:hypothetical protein
MRMSCTRTNGEKQAQAALAINHCAVVSLASFACTHSWHDAPPPSLIPLLLPRLLLPHCGSEPPLVVRSPAHSPADWFSPPLSLCSPLLQLVCTFLPGDPAPASYVSPCCLAPDTSRATLACTVTDLMVYLPPSDLLQVDGARPPPLPPGTPRPTLLGISCPTLLPWLPLLPPVPLLLPPLLAPSANELHTLGHHMGLGRQPSAWLQPQAACQQSPAMQRIRGVSRVE